MLDIKTTQMFLSVSSESRNRTGSNVLCISRSRSARSKIYSSSIIKNGIKIDKRLVYQVLCFRRSMELLSNSFDKLLYVVDTVARHVSSTIPHFVVDQAVKRVLKE